MSKITLIVHGGAGPDSTFIRQHEQDYKDGITDALNAGFAILEAGGSAVDAVEAAVNSLENNYLFNAGRGSALNKNAEVEMCASIMEGATGECGATAIVKRVKNPVSLAKNIMLQSRHIYLGATGAEHFADAHNLAKEPEAYFVTDHAYEQYLEKRTELEGKPNEKMHGTVGAVALDEHGNIAAATSTGGTEYNEEGRIGDSSMIGAGCYAANETCAVSATGDGEYNIRYSTCFHIAALVEYANKSLKDSCSYLLNEKCKDVEGDMGVIAINTSGDVVFEFNSERMHRGWKTLNAQEVAVY